MENVMFSLKGMLDFKGAPPWVPLSKLWIFGVVGSQKGASAGKQERVQRSPQVRGNCCVPPSLLSPETMLSQGAACALTGP